MAEQREFREFKAGDGVLTVQPSEWVILHFDCQDCGRASSCGILGPSFPIQLDCDEKRRCPDCQKQSLVRILKEAGCTLPERELLQMSVDGLLSFPGRPDA
jgi:hypothetical protein